MQFKSTETFPSLRHKSVRIKFHYCEYTKHSPLKIRIKLTHRRTKEIFPVHEENETKRERERERKWRDFALPLYIRKMRSAVRVPKEGRKEGSQPSANTLVTD